MQVDGVLRGSGALRIGGVMPVGVVRKSVLHTGGERRGRLRVGGALHANRGRAYCRQCCAYGRAACRWRASWRAAYGRGTVCRQRACLRRPQLCVWACCVGVLCVKGVPRAGEVLRSDVVLVRMGVLLVGGALHAGGRRAACSRSSAYGYVEYMCAECV